jgi:hypothetical protein
MVNTVIGINLNAQIGEERTGMSDSTMQEFRDGLYWNSGCFT